MTTTPQQPTGEPTEAEDAFFDQLYCVGVLIGTDGRFEAKPEAIALLRAYVSARVAEETLEYRKALRTIFILTETPYWSQNHTNRRDLIGRRAAAALARAKESP